MTIKHLEEYRDPGVSRRIIERIRKGSQQQIRLMEVCGTHTMSIFRHGIRAVLPETISLVSGPGCPVCVTAQNEIDAFIQVAGQPDVIVATFGDLLRVPGSGSSLQNERAAGKDVRMVYSTFDALALARENPDKQVVFLGVGFETTAPTIAASIISAADQNIDNYCVYCAHKLVPPALKALLDNADVRIDGFILPGHVSVIIGVDAYRELFDQYRIPCVVAGFEPGDILFAVALLVEQFESGIPSLQNAYQRAVTDEGNPRAKDMMNTVFKPVDTNWRGLGSIPLSGLKIRDAFASFDAENRFSIDVGESVEPKGCECGAILTGQKSPPQCRLYKSRCTPVHPVGPCMVSTEGTCAAYYKYSESD